MLQKLADPMMAWAGELERQLHRYQEGRIHCDSPIRDDESRYIALGLTAGAVHRGIDSWPNIDLAYAAGAVRVYRIGVHDVVRQNWRTLCTVF